VEATPLSWRWSPIEALRRWPLTLPIAALVSGAGDDEARWSVLGVPNAWREIPHGASREHSLASLRTIADGSGAARPRGPAPAARSADAPPFSGGWIGYLSYEFGAIAEPVALPGGARDPDFPLAGGWRCDAAAVHDARLDRWWWCGGGAPPDLADPIELECDLGPIRARLDRGRFESLVRRTIELIRAGDLYQANIAQRFEAPLEGDSPAGRRALAIAALASSGARYGAVVEGPNGRAVVSMSPELFLERRGDRVITRPIKGTRPRGADRREFLDNEKERAELAMIVDLMRNDLSRVCVPGSVRVRAARRIESHCGVDHALAEVEGSLRADAGTSDLVLATFPPGSVTGAPKVRAMQVIESLEASPRGPYCGAVGLFGDDGDCSLNVAIRTLCVRDGTVTCSTGCGIVNDSDPAAESRESELKLEPFRRTAEFLRFAGPPREHAPLRAGAPRRADAPIAALTPLAAAAVADATRSREGSAPPRPTAPAGGS